MDYLREVSTQLGFRDPLELSKELGYESPEALHTGLEESYKQVWKGILQNPTAQTLSEYAIGLLRWTIQDKKYDASLLDQATNEGMI